MSDLMTIKTAVQSEIDAIAWPRAFPYRPSIITPAQVADVLAVVNPWCQTFGTNPCGWENVFSGVVPLSGLLDRWLAMLVYRRGVPVVFTGSEMTPPPVYELQALAFTTTGAATLAALAASGIPVCRALLKLGYERVAIPHLLPGLKPVADLLGLTLPLTRRVIGHSPEGEHEEISLDIAARLALMERLL